MPVEVSVVIPARDAARVLPRTLGALRLQRRVRTPEIIVVDDGSVDGTAAVAAAEPGVRVLASGGRGPAAARNAGIRAASGRLVALLGADTIPGLDWLSGHLDAHRRHPGESVAVVGRIDWHPEVEAGPFVRWVNEAGPQFGFALIRDPGNLDARFFYSSNVTSSRTLLLEEPFDERFRVAAWEDIELGMRLRARGVRLVFAPTARVDHLHPTDLEAFLRRQRKVGAAAVRFLQVRPAAAGFLGFREGRAPRLPPRPLLRQAERAAAWLERRGVTVPLLWRWLCRAHYRIGVRRALQGERHPGPDAGSRSRRS